MFVAICYKFGRVKFAIIVIMHWFFKQRGAAIMHWFCKQMGLKWIVLVLLIIHLIVHCAPWFCKQRG